MNIKSKEGVVLSGNPVRFFCTEKFPTGNIIFPLLFFLFIQILPAWGQASVDRYDDLAVGVPFMDIGSVEDAGGLAVYYFYGSPFSQSLRKGGAGIPGTAVAHERFGTVLTAGDFNGDGWQDLAVGVPYEAIGESSDNGKVYILHGGPTGLRSPEKQVWYQTGTQLGSGDKFGFALAAGDFDHDGFSDLAIGIPGKKVDGIERAGAILVLKGSSEGLTAEGSEIWHQNVAGIPGDAEPDDNFGYTLTTGNFNGDDYTDLAIGVPWENVGAELEAGAVYILYGSGGGLTANGSQLWHENLLTLTSEAGDFFGNALAAGDFNLDGWVDLAIGSYGKNLGGSIGGAVTVLYGTPSGLSAAGRDYWRQSGEILGVEKDRDNFGKALASGDFNKDGFADLAIGVPGDDYSGVAGSGAVNVLYGSSGGLTTDGNQIWHLDLISVAGLNDGFGSVLTTGDFNGDGFSDLAIGVPYIDVGYLPPDSGAVFVIFGSITGLDGNLVRGIFPSQDRFGCALAAGKFGRPEGLIYAVDFEKLNRGSR